MRVGTAARVEQHGPLTLFVSSIPWRFYGRPRTGLSPADAMSADDVRALRARQRELGVREVLVLATASYVPGRTPGPAERFYFARGAGWYKWESVRGTVLFDRRGGPLVSMVRGCRPMP